MHHADIGDTHERCAQGMLCLMLLRDGAHVLQKLLRVQREDNLVFVAGK